MNSTRESAEFEKLLDEFNGAYASGGDWFGFFHPDATVYTIGSTEPFIGRASYEKNFGSLLKEKRKVQDLKRDIQVMADTAVTMQLQQVTQSEVVTIFRQSGIWVRQQGGWKIIHLHSALATNPQPESSANEARAIRVLTQKMAIVSSQVGVAQ
jgi:ketosteroid isomerase-like protein